MDTSPHQTDVENIELQLVEDELVEIFADLDTNTPRCDHSDKWCVYLSSHPLGFYYLGKGITTNVLSGAYKGSGASLRASWEWYPKDEWTAEVLETFQAEPLDERQKDPGEAKAYAREKEIISLDMLFDPFCLNDSLGGGGSWGQGVTVKAVERRRKAVKASWEDPAIREKHRLGSIKRWDSDVAREKHRDTVRHTWRLKKETKAFQESVAMAREGRVERERLAKELRKKNSAATRANANKILSEKAIDRLATKRKEKYQSLIPQFMQCLDTCEKTKNGFVIPKKALESLGAVSSQTVDMFKSWLDDNHIPRWGSEEHKASIIKAEEGKQLRISELNKKKAKIYKMSPETRKKMSERQFSHSLKPCNFCGLSFRPACFGRYHGINCKSNKKAND